MIVGIRSSSIRCAALCTLMVPVTTLMVHGLVYEWMMVKQNVGLGSLVLSLKNSRALRSFAQSTKANDDESEGIRCQITY